MFAALPLAWKIGAPMMVALLALGGYIFWEHTQQSIGRAEAEAEYRDELLKQQQEATGYYIVSAARKLQAVERTGAEKDRLNAQLRRTYQTIVELDRSQDEQDQNGVRHEPCVVSPLVRGAVNDLGRVLNDTSSERAPATDGTASESTRSPGRSASGDTRAGDGAGPIEADPRTDGETDRSNR